MRDSSAARTRRIKALLMAVIASAFAASALSAGTAQAATVTVFPNTPSTGNCYPFGRGAPGAWRPFAAFIYQNVPAFELQTGDTLAFDLGAVNDADIELDIDLARTVTNGTVVEGEPFQTVVTNNQTPLNPRGDTTVGNFELKFTAEFPFSFPGGGLIMRFSDPSPSYEADGTCTQVLVYGNSTDTSGFFVRRAFGDPDGVAPWAPFDSSFIGAFQVVTTDPTPPPPPPDPLPPPDDAPPPGDTPPPGADTTAPQLLLSGPTAQRLRRVVRVRAACDEDCTVRATGKVVVRQKRKRVRAKLKPASASLAARERRTLKPMLSKKNLRKVRRALKKPGARARARLRVRATDASGNTAIARRTVKLRR